MDITFSCESCGQSIVIDEAGAGQLVDCPKCGTTLEVPYKSKSSDDVAMPSLPPDKTVGAYPWLPKTIFALVIGALMLGSGLFAHKLWKDQQIAKAEEARAEAAKAEAARVEAARVEAAKAEASKAKQKEEMKAQEAKAIADGENAAKAQYDAELRNAEAVQLVDKAGQQLKATMQQSTLLQPDQAIAQIQAAVQQFEAAMHQAEALSPLEPAERARVENAMRQLEQSAQGYIHKLEMDRVKVVDFAWTKDESGSFIVASFTIKNQSATDVKDIQITCHHYAPSGTEIDSNVQTIYEIIPSGHVLTVRNFNMGLIHAQAVRSAAEVTDYTVMK